VTQPTPDYLAAVLLAETGRTVGSADEDSPKWRKKISAAFIKDACRYTSSFRSASALKL
jgi:hypothetical protein